MKDVNATLNREHVRPLHAYARRADMLAASARGRSKAITLTHLDAVLELARRLDRLAQGAPEMVTPKDLQLLDHVVNRLMESARGLERGDTTEFWNDSSDMARSLADSIGHLRALVRTHAAFQG